MKYILFIALLTVSVFGCKKPEQSQSDENNSPEEIAPKYPELFEKFLAAHGGLDTWNKYSTLTYTIESTLGRTKTEEQVIDLKSRKVLIKNDSFNIGMDGNQVWVTPSKEAFGAMSPRFYHNLFFYFFALPHVLADQGAFYEDLGEREIEGKKYLALKVSFGSDIGDAPDDFYIAHLNPDTYQLEVLLYTVTYFTGEKTQKFNSLLYKEWQQVGGLVVPGYMEGHKYEDGKIGDLRYSSKFTNVTLEESAPDQTQFEMPEGAVVDSLKNN